MRTETALKRAVILAFLAVLLIFAVGLFMPAGAATGILYISCFVLLRGAGKKPVVLLLLFSILLILISLVILPGPELTPLIVFNKVLVVLALIFTAGWAIRDRNLRDINDREALSHILALKDKDEKIRLREAYFYNLIENMLEGVQLISRDHRYLYVNKVLEKQSGYRKDELLGYSMSYRYPGIENTELMAQINKCLEAGEDATFINEFSFPDGAKGYFELYMHPVAEGLFILSVDVTDRIRAEKQKATYTESLENKLRNGHNPNG